MCAGWEWGRFNHCRSDRKTGENDDTFPSAKPVKWQRLGVLWSGACHRVIIHASVAYTNGIHMKVKACEKLQVLWVFHAEWISWVMMIRWHSWKYFFDKSLPASWYATSGVELLLWWQCMWFSCKSKEKKPSNHCRFKPSNAWVGPLNFAFAENLQIIWKRMGWWENKFCACNLTENTKVKHQKSIVHRRNHSFKVEIFLIMPNWNCMQMENLTLFANIRHQNI